ncbi:MAG: beta-galactosidase, partial [Terriglobia bacterium]
MRSRSMRWEDWPGMPSHSHPFWWAQIDFTKPHNIAWDGADFATLARSGMSGVEINLDWAGVEPHDGAYDFRLLDRYMAEAARAHLKIYLLFWESVWGEKQGKNPPPWISARDLSSDGVKALEPPWWDEVSRKAYFDYVAHTIDHVKSSPGFGGVYAAYGWLDSEWGPAPKGSHGVTGYAPADI